MKKITGNVTGYKKIKKWLTNDMHHSIIKSQSNRLLYRLHKRKHS
jgi:hypothetical protein